MLVIYSSIFYFNLFNIIWSDVLNRYFGFIIKMPQMAIFPPMSQNNVEQLLVTSLSVYT